MLCGFANDRPPTRLARLSTRERELVPYFARGLPNKVVAIEFGISERTAEAHRARIFRKLGVRSVVELACCVCPHRQPAEVQSIDAHVQIIDVEPVND